jgi:hypothetical protein
MFSYNFQARDSIKNQRTSPYDWLTKFPENKGGETEILDDALISDW